MTKIVLAVSENLSRVYEYFTFNQYDIDTDDLWDSLDSTHFIDSKYLNSSGMLLVVDYPILMSLLSESKSFLQLKMFLKNNYLWVWGELDSFSELESISKNKTYSSLLSTQNATFYIDAEPSNDSLRNFKYSTVLGPYFWTLPRIYRSEISKKSCEFDFLITTILKRTAPHRKILINDLSARPDICSRGFISARPFKNKNQGWVGQTSHQHSWNDGFPSMDLYRNAWMEVVPETRYKNFHFLTEKTLKPLMTKTPFLMLSTCGYLDYLRRLGFKTFNTLIDESYDLEYCVEDRVKKVVDTLSTIIKNGSKEFYHEAESILEHNHQHLGKISGLKIYQTDLMFKRHLEEINLAKLT